MTISDRDWELLNGYLDGELSPEDALEIERLLSSDEEMQSAYARLVDLKDTMRGLKPRSEDRLAPDTTPRRMPLVWISGIAASIAVIGLLGVLGIYWLNPAPTAEMLALEMHNTLSQKTYVLDERSPKLAVSNVRYGRLDIPDLTLSSLSLVDVLTTAISGKEVIAMHYRGQHGCRLSLIGIEQDPAGEKPEFSISDSVLKQSWQHNGFFFVALADGMDENRFRAITAYLVEETKGSVEKLQQLQIAMGQAYQNSRPCV